MSESIKTQLKQQAAAQEIGGQELMALERFAEDTRHMIIFEVRKPERGRVGNRERVYLSDEGYNQAQECAECGEIKIIRHARVVKGNLHYDTQEREK
ncbi:hypothetical protein FACS1894191_4000 [Clostridia bacterium]|nr:hypothetical protein FACS1894191_4000 [Clostridia bacterium]